MECFGGWGKGEPGETQGGGGASRVGASMGGEGPGEGKLDGCIMHQGHTSNNNNNNKFLSLIIASNHNYNKLDFTSLVSKVASIEITPLSPSETMACN